VNASYVYSPHERVRASGGSEHRTSDNERYVRSLTVLRTQLRAAIALGDRAAELILGARLRPTTCATFDCARKARPDGRLCQSCFERLVYGRVAS